MSDLKESWSEYFEKTMKCPPSQTAELVLAMCGDKKGLVIDLGCGAGVDSVYFLKNGWKTIAIDGDTDFIEKIKADLPKELKDKLEIKNMKFESLDIPSADLISANYSLPFCNPKSFNKMWNTIVSSLNTGGRFSGTFFGIHDEWIEDFADSRTFHTKDEVLELFKGFEIEKLEEAERDGQCCGKSGKPFPKHWHTFFVIARKL